MRRNLLALGFGVFALAAFTLISPAQGQFRPQKSVGAKNFTQQAGMQKHCGMGQGQTPFRQPGNMQASSGRCCKPGQTPFGQSGGFQNPFQQAGRFQNPVQQAGRFQNPIQQAGRFQNPVQQAGRFQNPLQQAGGFQNPIQQAGGFQNPIQQAGRFQNPLPQAGTFASPVQQGSAFQYGVQQTAFKSPLMQYGNAYGQFDAAQLQSLMELMHDPAAAWQVMQTPIQTQTAANGSRR